MYYLYTQTDVEHSVTTAHYYACTVRHKGKLVVMLKCAFIDQ